jgi:hypothetical protein
MTDVEEPQKYFILHLDQVAMHLFEITFQNGKMYGVLAPLPSTRDLYKKTELDRLNRYTSREKYVLHEVHIYLPDTMSRYLDPGPVEVALSDITEIHIYDQDIEATVASYVAGFAGIGLTVGLGVAILNYNIFSSSSPSNSPGGGSSCPFVYANDGQSFKLQGEIFSGAMFHNLERHDYLPLPDLRPLDGNYQIMISNERNENQHINLARLSIVEHPLYSYILFDQEGRPHTIKDPQVPVTARSSKGIDIQSQVEKKDNLAFYFEDVEVLYNAADLQFDKPKDFSSSKLVLNIKNSHWVDLMFGEYTAKYGSRYNQWLEKQNARPASEHLAWMDAQGLRLRVFVLIQGQWKLMTSIENIGPQSYREVVVPLDLSAHSGDQLHVRLEGGSLFWALDYAAMDFTKNLDVKVTEVSPVFTTSGDDQTYTLALSRDDTAYLHQLNTGDQVIISYKSSTTRSGYQQSMFLHSKGYYEPVRDYKGLPDLITLQKFDQPGYFIKFSNDRFKSYLKEASLL